MLTHTFQTIENEGAATNWTLSFKHENITILLYAEPLTPITSIKEELLSVLVDRYPSGLPQASPSTPSSEIAEETASIPHPSDPADIILGKKADDADEDAQWEEIDLGKGSKGTPKGVGLKDGSCVAFAYKEAFDEEVGFVVKRSTYYEDQARADEEGEEEAEEEGEEDQMDED